MTDDMPITRLGSDEVIEAIRQDPQLAPIYQAILKDDVHVLKINQGIEPFNIPSAGRPWIIFIEDDPKPGNLSLGPEEVDFGRLDVCL